MGAEKKSPTDYVVNGQTESLRRGMRSTEAENAEAEAFREGPVYEEEREAENARALAYEG